MGRLAWCSCPELANPDGENLPPLMLPPLLNLPPLPFSTFSFLILYCISRNCPSGGTNESARSLAKRAKRTDGWSLASPSMCGLWKVSAMSGIPLSLQLHCTSPIICMLTTWPSLFSVTSTSSVMSKKISLLECLTPARRQGTLERTPSGKSELTTTPLLPDIALDNRFITLGGGIMSLRMFSSVIHGIPLSHTSSSNWYTVTKCARRVFSLVSPK
mmetsp:Transcript_44982/g.75053  ORF Transcript_44982/g.75053 Transcript_44982/m.75053 type:complete len:216 (-) Transcript_44982:538-1185(-)